MITTDNTAGTDATSRYLGRNTADALDLCDERRDLKKKQYEAEEAKEYRQANKRMLKAVKKAKENWISAQCEEIAT